MFLLTIFAFIFLWLQHSERNDIYKAAYDGSFFSYQVTSAGDATYAQDSSFDNDLV